MVRLLVIADDFTGALDTGVQFAKKGIRTRVLVREAAGGASDALLFAKPGDAEVLVVDTETRHMNAEAAYACVFSVAAQAREAGIPFFYKKTDSALRGNIGSELSALLDASGERALPFVPAFPRMKRITRKGIHYIDGVPVSKSVFGQDPFEPVRKDAVREIVEMQSKTRVTEVESPDEIPWEEAGIWVFDAASDEDTEAIAKRLKEGGAYRILAGCAGFAAALPELLGLYGTPREPEALGEKLFVVCGSVNPITRRQLQYAADRGHLRMHLSMEERLDKDYWSADAGREKLVGLLRACESHACCIVDSNDRNGQQDIMDYAKEHGMSMDEIRGRITGTLGTVLRMLLADGLQALLLVTGGDTLLGFMKEIGIRELEPICELLPGCVLTGFHYAGRDYRLVTKSGGFGEEDLLEEIVHILEKQR